MADGSPIVVIPPIPIEHPISAKACEKLYTNKDKWLVSLLASLLFLLIASPWAYRVTNSIFEGIGLKTAKDKDGCPTGTGLLIHGLVFLFIVRALMR